MTGDCCVPATRGPGPRLVPSARFDRSLKKILSDPHDFQSPYATVLHRRDRTSQVLSDGCYNDCCDRWRLVSSDRIPTIAEPFFCCDRSSSYVSYGNQLSLNFLQFPAIRKSASRAVHLCMQFKCKCVESCQSNP